MHKRLKEKEPGQKKQVPFLHKKTNSREKFSAPPFGGIFCIFWYKTYKDCEINNYQLNHLTKHGKIWLSIGGQSGKKKGDLKTMGYKSDIEIAQECTMQPITAIAEKAGIDDKYLEQYGKYKAKIDYNLLKDTDAEDGKLILVTAINPTPAGEGKTTTLYSIIDYLNRPQINITTIEDPVEIRIDGLNQIEVDAKASFSSSLRTVLRQDPDIILVGEIRDRETAEIAMQAGQTGHYVLSTIHTIDSIEVITRLRKMGMSNYDISSILATSVSQRLVRKICPYCAKERDFTDKEKEIINKIGEKYNTEFDFKGKKTYEPVGCKKCNQSGYLNRIGIFEVLNIDDEVRDLIARDGSSMEIRAKALELGYKPLVIDGLKKVLNGITTLDEINNKLIIY